MNYQEAQALVATLTLEERLRLLAIDIYEMGELMKPGSGKGLASAMAPVVLSLIKAPPKELSPIDAKTVEDMAATLSLYTPHTMALLNSMMCPSSLLDYALEMGRLSVATLREANDSTIPSNNR